MLTNRLLLGAALLGAAMTAGCHAHGVATTDHQVTLAFSRQLTDPSKATLTITNGAPQPICLGPAAFDPASFSVKTDKGATAQSVAPAAPTAPACTLLAAGAAKTLIVDAGAGFSRYDEQTGRFCYNYAFASAPGGAAAWQASGAVCE